MSDETREPNSPQGGDEEDRASTPFDHPFFLPVLLFLGAIWFGYDGWFNEEIQAIDFNRYGFGVLLALAIYFTYRAVKETRGAKPDADRASE